MGLIATQRTHTHTNTHTHTHTHTYKHTDVPPTSTNYSCIHFERTVLAKRSGTNSSLKSLSHILPDLHPSIHSLDFHYLTVLRAVTLFVCQSFIFPPLYLSIPSQGYFILTFFYLLHIKPPIHPSHCWILPLLWGYSDLFTTPPPSLSSPPIFHLSITADDRPSPIQPFRHLYHPSLVAVVYVCLTLCRAVYWPSLPLFFGALSFNSLARLIYYNFYHPSPSIHHFRADFLKLAIYKKITTLSFFRSLFPSLHPAPSPLQRVRSYTAATSFIIPLFLARHSQFSFSLSFGEVIGGCLGLFI